VISVDRSVSQGASDTLYRLSDSRKRVHYRVVEGDNGERLYMRLHTSRSHNRSWQVMPSHWTKVRAACDDAITEYMLWTCE
jgi:hypothetical protein